MSNVRTLTRSFNGGEVTPEFWGRMDDVKYQTGLASCVNFIPKPHGPLDNRSGTKFVREVKTSAKKTRLINFAFSPTQTFAIEMGEGYFRFHTSGATLLAGTATAWSNVTAYVIGDMASLSGTNYYCIASHTNQTPPNVTYWYPIPSTAYEIPSPYLEADLFDIHYVQSNDVFTIVHPNYAPRELRRLGATKWVLSTISFAATLAGPATVNRTLTGGATTPVDTYAYSVTAIDVDGNESTATASTAVGPANLGNPGAYIDVSWSGVGGAVAYNVYKQANSESFGFMGQTTSTTFRDNNISPDLSRTPPLTVSPFDTDFPAAVTYFEQRRGFFGTTLKPQNGWLTKSGLESNLSESKPSRDDDSIKFKVSARELNTIRHAVPLNSLILLTTAAEWRVASVDSGALTPSTLSVRPQSYIGSSNVQPVIVNNNLIFAAARGGHVRELAYSLQANGYLTGDLSIRAPHLFDNLEIRDMTYVKSPQPIVLYVSSNGRMLGQTYVPDQSVGAWHQYVTDGLFESVTSVVEGSEDAIYVIVKRTIGGVDKRFVERFASRQFTTASDAYFVDCGLTYSGAPATVFSGLSHLEGKTVSILGDGAVFPQQVVTSGQVTLDQAVSKCHIGLPYNSDMQSLPLAFEAQAFGQGRTKNVNTVWLRVFRSSGIFIGPDFTHLREEKHRTNEVYGSAPNLKTQEVKLAISPTWQDGGQVVVRQSDPLPLTIVNMTLEVAIGS